MDRSIVRTDAWIVHPSHHRQIPHPQYKPPGGSSDLMLASMLHLQVEHLW